MALSWILNVSQSNFVTGAREYGYRLFSSALTLLGFQFTLEESVSEEEIIRHYETQIYDLRASLNETQPAAWTSMVLASRSSSA